MKGAFRSRIEARCANDNRCVCRPLKSSSHAHQSGSRLDSNCPASPSRLSHSTAFSSSDVASKNHAIILEHDDHRRCVSQSRVRGTSGESPVCCCCCLPGWLALSCATACTKQSSSRVAGGRRQRSQLLLFLLLSNNKARDRATITISSTASTV